MADGITMTLIGAANLQRKLKRIPDKDAKKAIRKGSRAGAKIITRQAKKRARSDLETHEKNAIGPAIKTRAAKRSRRYVGTVTTVGEGFFKGATFYAAFVEFGHKAGSRKLGGMRRDVEGKHFLQKAADDVKARAGRKASVVMLKEIELLAKR